MNKKNIIVGAARIYLGPAASTDAEITSVKPAYKANERYTETLKTDNSWEECGYTTDGLEVATDPSWGEVQVDQLLDSAKIFKDSMSFKVSTTFAEATLENLLIAWGQQTSTLTSSGATDKELAIEGGSLGEAPLERGLIAVGNATEKAGADNQYGERVYHVYRVLSVEGVSHSLSRSDATTIPVSFRALPADNGRYGTVRDRLGV